MNAESLQKVIKLRALKFEYWYMVVDNAKSQNMNQVLSHLENINKIESQIKNLESNQIINFIFFN